MNLAAVFCSLGLYWLVFMCAAMAVMEQQNKTYGITSPISLASPTQKDRILTQKLEETIEPYGVFETESEMQKRLVVLGKMNEIVKEFVRKVRKVIAVYVLKPGVSIIQGDPKRCVPIFCSIKKPFFNECLFCCRT